MSVEVTLLIVKLIVLFAAFALSIVNLVWIYKANHNALDEPNNRLNYYSFEDAIIGPDDFYSSGEFCYEHYQPFLDIGALEDLDIKMKKIKKFSLGLMILLFFSLYIKLISMDLDLPDSFICCDRSGKLFKVIRAVTQILNLLSSILAFIFFIITSAHYFKSNFDDFDKFRDCEYLNSLFDKDYDFINIVKKNYLRFFIGYIVVLVLNFTELILEIILHSCYKIYQD
jgi:hypothetical protein